MSAENKAFVLDTMRKIGRTAAESLQECALDMSGTEILRKNLFSLRSTRQGNICTTRLGMFA